MLIAGPWQCTCSQPEPFSQRGISSIPQRLKMPRLVLALASSFTRRAVLALMGNTCAPTPLGQALGEL